MSLDGLGSLRAVATEAYFYSHVFVGSRRVPGTSVLVDLERRQVSASGTPGTFEVDAPGLCHEPRPYEDPGTSYVSIPIRWGADMCLSISFSRNPQVRNGVRLTGTAIATGRATGLLMRNYRACFFRLPRVESLKPTPAPDGRRRATTQRGTAGHGEVQVSVRVK